MNDSQNHQTNNADSSQAIHIELPVGVFDGMCKMMSDFMRISMPKSACCKPTEGRCCPDANKGEHYEITVISKRKE